MALATLACDACQTRIGRLLRGPGLAPASTTCPRCVARGGTGSEVLVAWG